MKNQNSISKPTVIIKPPPSVSAGLSSKKEKLPLDKKMDFETNQQQSPDSNNNNTNQQNNYFSENINETTTDTPLTDKVWKKNPSNI